jgi:hypothetical protein
MSVAHSTTPFITIYKEPFENLHSESQYSELQLAEFNTTSDEWIEVGKINARFLKLVQY